MRTSVFFVDCLPRKGLKLPDKHQFLKRDNQNTQVLRAFISAGVVLLTSNTNTPDNKASKEAVEKALVALFVDAAGPNALALLDTWDFMSNLQEKTAWAAGLSESIFTQFFHNLVDARKNWRRDPQPPFDTDQHSALAQQIDVFLVAAGDNIVLADVNRSFLELAGGFDEDQDEDEDEERDGHDGEIGGAPNDTTTDAIATSLFNSNGSMDSLCGALIDRLNEDMIAEGGEEMGFDD